MEITIGQELEIHIRLKSGDTIEQVRVLELLGEGGFAKVWKVRDQATGKKYALKLIDIAVLIAEGKLVQAKQEMLLERIRREAEVTVKSPYILTCLGFRELEQQAGVFLLFDLFGEHDLKEWIAENQLVRWSAKKALFLKILKGVSAIHQAGYVHRDLKPQNILIDERNVPKITDFGLVKTQASMHTQEWSFAGTFPYQDPYLIQAGGIKHADARSDVYALGIILYEMIMGADPWTQNELYHFAFVKGEIFNIIAGKEHILDVDEKFEFTEDPAVTAIIEQSTTFDREKRVITLDDMIRHFGGKPSIAKPVQPPSAQEQHFLATMPEDLIEQAEGVQPVEPPKHQKTKKAAPIPQPRKPQPAAKPAPESKPKSKPTPPEKSQKPRGFPIVPVIIVLLIAGAAGYALWHTIDEDQSDGHLIQPTPTATSTPEPPTPAPLPPTPTFEPPTPTSVPPTPTVLPPNSRLRFDLEFVYQPLTEGGEDVVRLLHDGETLHSGDCYQIRFRFNPLIRGQTYAYVYLFHGDPGGKATRIVQLNDVTTLRNPVQRGKVYATRCFPVEGRTGRHELYLLASSEPVMGLEATVLFSRYQLQQYAQEMEYASVRSFQYR